MEEKSATQWEWILPDDACHRNGLIQKIYEYICDIKPGAIPNIMDLLVAFMLMNIVRNGGMSLEFLWQECQKHYPQVSRSGFNDAFNQAFAYATKSYGLIKGGGYRPPRCDS